MKNLVILAAFAAALAGSLAATPAAAQASASAERVVVRYADLDLSSRAGVSALNRRILTAVQAACGPISNSDPHGTNLVIECRHRTFDQAVSQASRAIAQANRNGTTLLAAR